MVGLVHKLSSDVKLWVFAWQAASCKWRPTPILLPGKSHGQRAWWATVHGVAKSRTQLSDLTFTFHFHALEKEMITHSSVLAWRIPRMGEPGGLASMGSHRVRHNWNHLAAAAAAASCKESESNCWLIIGMNRMSKDRKSKEEQTMVCNKNEWV